MPTDFLNQGGSGGSSSSAIDDAFLASLGFTGLDIDIDEPFFGGFYGSGICGSTTTLWGQDTASGAGFGIRDGAAYASAANPGVIEIFSGTSASNVSFITNLSGGGKPIFIGGGKTYFEVTAALPTASDGTNTFGIMMGIVTAPGGTYGTVATDGNYISQTDAINSGKLLGACSNSSSHTTRDLGAALGATFAKLGWFMNSTGTSVQFYLNRVATGSPVTLNIPSASTAVRFMVSLQKTAGTTSRSLLIDRLKFAVQLN